MSVIIQHCPSFTLQVVPSELAIIVANAMNGMAAFLFDCLFTVCVLAVSALKRMAI